PEPVISVAIEPKTKADQDKRSIDRQKLSEEDPTFRVHTDAETAQTIISGMGELHLEIIVDRMKREFKVDANVGRPQVAYRETVRKRVEYVEGKFIRQTGGRGQYGHVVITLEPGGPVTGLVCEDKVGGAASAADSARAGHGRGGGDARRLHGRRDRRPLEPARQDRRHDTTRRRSRGGGERSAVGDVWLLHDAALDEPGPRHLQHAVQP